MKALHIAILAKDSSPTVTNELAPILESRGHTVSIIDISTAPLHNFLLCDQVTQLLQADLVYFRSGLPFDLATILGSFLREKNIPTVNLQFHKHPFADSKSYGTIFSEIAGFAVPLTLHSPTLSYEAIRVILGEHFIAKPNTGARGESVELIKNSTQWDLLQNKNTSDYLYQSFIPHDFECRVHTIGGKAVAMYKRTPPADDFRSNVSQGAVMTPVPTQLQAELTTLAEKAATLFSFEILAIDFMLNKDTNEFIFTEINLNPGWEKSDEQATGVDLSLMTAQYFESLCS